MVAEYECLDRDLGPRPDVSAGDPATTTGETETNAEGFVLIPQSWVERGVRTRLKNRHDRALYAVSARSTDDDERIAVRYIHPYNNEVFIPAFPVYSLENGVVPESLANGQWKAVVSYQSLSPHEMNGHYRGETPTKAELAHLFSLYDFSETMYSDPFSDPPVEI